MHCLEIQSENMSIRVAFTQDYKTVLGVGSVARLCISLHNRTSISNALRALLKSQRHPRFHRSTLHMLEENTHHSYVKGLLCMTEHTHIYKGTLR